MGLLEKALADLMTSQHETNTRMGALADALEETAKKSEEAAKKSEEAAKKSEEAARLTRETAKRTREVVEQGKKTSDLLADVINHLGGVAETIADHEVRLKNLEAS